MSASGEKVSFFDVMSRPGWACLVLGFMPILLALLQPPLVDFAAFLGIDFAALPVALAVDRLLFPRLYPRYGRMFPALRLDAACALDEAGRRELFQTLIAFPRDRAAYSVPLSIFKTLPAAAYLLLYWQIPLALHEKILILVCLLATTNSYLGGACYLEQHCRVSATLRALHRRCDWSAIFRAAGPSVRALSWRPTVTVMTLTGLLVIATQLVTVATHTGGPIWLAVKVAIAGLGGLLLLGRILFIAHRHTMGGLQQIFADMEGYRPERAPPVLPLHSSAPLARFETIINELGARHVAYEREIAQWVLANAEQSRFHAIGEIAGLVAHDLGTPLAVIGFCAEQLKRCTDPTRRAEYESLLAANVQRSGHLVHSLQAYLRNDADEPASVGDVVRLTMRVLEAQHPNRELDRIRVTVDPQLDRVLVDMPRAKLMHVMLNLTSNAARNLLDHDVAGATLAIRLTQDAARVQTGRIELEVEDNGTGLSAERFERLTGAEGELAPGSLGLKLVRRLVERSGGSLGIAERGPGVSGTRLLLSLPGRCQSS